MIDDAVLVLSELLSNSCRHARPLEYYDGGDGTDRTGAQAPVERFGPETRDERDAGIRASWSVGQDGLLLLEVTDGGGPTRPRPSSPSLTAHGGRGLGIVGNLAHRWGVRDAPGEVTVWVLIPVRGRHARRDDNPTGIGLPMGVPLDLPLDLAESLDDLG